MIYKSRDDEIRARLTELEGVRLFKLKPSLPKAIPVRDLFVSEEVRAGVQRPFPDSPDGEQQVFFRNMLDSFVMGRRMTLADDPFTKPTDTEMARTGPADQDIWDFRILTDRDGIRCFGAFGGFNCFVALTWNFRDPIKDFAAETMSCRQVWMSLFGDVPPFKRKRIDEYGTGFVAV